MAKAGWDIRWIQRLRRHEEEAMGEFLRQFSPLMRYIIAPILSDPREQEECLQDVAMRVWDRIAQYDETRGSFTAWLTALTRNTALNRAKSSGRIERMQEVSADETPEDIASAEAGPEEQVIRQERAHRIRQAVAALNNGDQQLFYRKYYYMQPTAQIAAEMGMSERAVEGRLYRVKKKLRQELGGEWYG